MITWDEKKRKRNILEHGIDLADLEVVFDFPMQTTRPTTPKDGTAVFVCFRAELWC